MIIAELIYKQDISWYIKTPFNSIETDKDKQDLLEYMKNTTIDKESDKMIEDFIVSTEPEYHTLEEVSINYYSDNIGEYDDLNITFLSY